MGRGVLGRRAGGLIAPIAVLVAGCSPRGGSSEGSVSSPVASSTVVSFSTGARSCPVESRSTRSSPPSTTTRPRTSATVAPSSFPVPRTSVALPSGVATEASGLTPTSAGDGTFWTVDDGTGTDSVIAIDERGREVGSLRVQGMSAGNAEAIASAACAAGSADRCLFVGDIGDHVGRDDVTVIRVPEPRSAAGAHSAAGTVWHYTYPDGARNAESLFVAPDGSLVVIDKPARTDDGSVRAHHVYRGRPGGGVLELVGTFTPPKPSMPLQSMFEGNVLTDAALQVGPARTRVLVQFYDQVLQYTAPQRTSDPALFFRWPQVALEDPELVQAEGIAPLADGCGFASISEAGPGGSVSRLSVAPCR